MKPHLPLALLPAALLCWGLPALAQDAPPPAPTSPFSISAKAKSAKVALGGEIELEITIKNVGEAEALGRPVALSTHSVMIELSGERFGEAKRYLARFPGGIAKLKPQAQVAIAPGKSLTGTIKLPTVEAGKLTIKPVYMGFVPHPRQQGQRPPQPVFGEAGVEVEVTPTEGGGKFAVAKMVTNHGTVRFRFYDEAAPCHVRNFIDLAKREFYKGLTFHRVIKGFMIQGGDPDGDGSGGPGYSIPGEFSRSPKYTHRPGAIAAARTSNPHSAGSQFYVCLGSPSHLNGQYTVFGQVYEGQDVINTIGAVETGDADKPKEDCVIQSLSIEYVAEIPAAK